MAKWQDFQQCPQCSLDFGTGEGTRACAWTDCPYLPEELNVFCGYCRFDFFTMEGNSPCPDPLLCEHATEPLEHVGSYRTWLAARPPAARAR
jgi:hypothetical protein